MRKLLLLQIGLAVMAFSTVAWIFFRERPQAEINHQLRQELNVAQEQNVQLKQAVQPTQNDPKESRIYLNNGRAFFHQQQYEDAVKMYNKAIEFSPEDPYGWSLKGYALLGPAASRSQSKRTRRH